MACNNPISLNGVLLDCGKCKGCRKSKVASWAARIMHESMYWKEASFVTWTYDDGHLPDDRGIHKRDMQLFWKRFREADRKKLRYLCTGEYGDRYSRPHYHAVVFGYGPGDWESRSRVIGTEKDGSVRLEVPEWKKGFVHVGTLTPSSARYVAGYITKKLNGPLAKEIYGQKERPFILVSKGFGKQFALDNRRQLENQLSATLNGVHSGVPRYYRKILGWKDTDTSIRLQIHAKMGKAKQHERCVAVYGRLPTKEEFEEFCRLERIQKEKNLEAKLALKESKI